MICMEALYQEDTAPDCADSSSTSTSANASGGEGAVRSSDGRRSRKAPADLQKVIVLPCAHLYHAECIKWWFNKAKTCPFCKRPARPTDCLPVDNSETASSASPKKRLANSSSSRSSSSSSSSGSSSSSSSSSSGKSPRKKAASVGGSIASGPLLLPPAGADGSGSGGLGGGLSSVNLTADFRADDSEMEDDGEGEGEEDGALSDDQDLAGYDRYKDVDEEEVEVQGEWGTKVEALVADLLRMVRKPGLHREEKAIVFTQWVEMLSIVGEALKANGIAYSLVKDKAGFSRTGPLERFKSDIDTRVLLLPLQHGAEGLDLVQACHVFLLEPLVNAALEQQAVNRCHRLGQQRQCVIHKYAVRGTIEERIVRGQRSRRFAEGADEGATAGAGPGAGTGAGAGAGAGAGIAGVGSPGGSTSSGSPRKKSAGKKDQDALNLSNIRYLLGLVD